MGEVKNGRGGMNGLQQMCTVPPESLTFCSLLCFPHQKLPHSALKRQEFAPLENSPRQAELARLSPVGQRKSGFESKRDRKFLETLGLAARTFLSFFSHTQWPQRINLKGIEQKWITAGLRRLQTN
jgi:hypothetical protein